MFCYFINKGFLIEYMFSVKYEVWKKNKISTFYYWFKSKLKCSYASVKVLKFNNHPFIRIFIVIGTIYIVTLLSNKHLLLFLPLIFIVLFLALLHFIYIAYISITKLWYGFKVLRSDN